MLLRNAFRAQLLSAPAGTQLEINNPLFRTILRANSFLAIFYADLLRRRAANPRFFIDLEI
jgi:hypothetical protein